MVYKTHAIVGHGPKQEPTIREVVLDNIRADEAVVEIHAVGICHADVAILQGVIPSPFPRVLGHEGSGVVKEVGSTVTHVQPGDKVLLSFNPCGRCKNCNKKLPSYCDDFEQRLWSGLRSDGTTTLKSSANADATPVYGNFFGQSSFSRLALVSGSSMIKVQQDTDIKLLAPLGCGIQTGTGVVWNALNVQQGESFIVSGCGAVGMSAIMAARHRGATTIIAVDIKNERLQLAKELGVTHAINGMDKDVIQRIREICPLPAGVNHALDTTGLPAVIETMLDAIGVRGQIVVVGATALDKKVGIQPLEFLNMGKRFIGSVEGDCYPPEAIPQLIELHRQGSLPLEKLVGYYLFDDFATALKDMEEGRVVKPVLVCVN
ncbi:Alcohol dehydrogenase GroES-like domain-containing protein [Cladophialophora immunda]|nr:Alcohol dehydrogenase GroES-like domain-containing protein [Cladophialophora immunda]